MPSNESPQAASPDRRSPDYPLAFFVLSVAGVAFWFGWGIQGTAVGSQYDPGPRFFPWLLAAILAVWGAGALIHSMILSLSSNVGLARSVADVDSRRSIWPAVLLMLGLTFYIPAISLVGFTLSTIVFVATMVYWLTGRASVASDTAPVDLRWRVVMAFGVSVALVVVVRVLFIWAFKVQLPGGMLGLPF